MKPFIKLGIIGDFNPDYPSHVATNEAINHAGDVLGISVDLQWLPTISLEKQPAILKKFNALWCSPGSPYQSMTGALEAIRFVREQDYPFLGTWGGFQHTLLEYARNVQGIEDADHEESNPETTNPFISKLSCSLAGQAEIIGLKVGTLAYQIYGKGETIEKYRCSYSLNPEYRDQIYQSKLKVVGTNDKGEIRIIELEGKRFFLASLFLPQMNSSPDRPHPMIVEYLKAALRIRKVKQDI